MENKKPLSSLNIKKDWIYEALIETINQQGKSHIRPMGVYSKDLKQLCMDMYKSNTLSNLMENTEASIYLPADSIDLVIHEKKELESKCLARIDVVLTNTKQLDKDSSRLTFKVKGITRLREGKPLNRAQGLFIEYLIDRSRLHLHPKHEDRIKYYSQAIAKVAPESVYYEHINEKITEVEVIAPSRLHFGLLDLNGSVGRVDGSAGVSLSNPLTHVVVRRSGKSKINVEGGSDHDRNRAKEFAEKTLSKLNISEGIDVHLKSVLSSHVGFGSTTSLGMSVGAAISTLFNSGLKNKDIAEIIGRGGTSGIGVAGFDAGGFIVDGGHDFTIKGKKFLPSGYSNIEAPPVVTRCALPPNWFFVCIIPELSRMYAKREMDFFREKCPISEEETNMLSRIILFKLIPSALEENIVLFGEALSQMQGIGFKKYEVERLGDSITILLDYLTGNSMGAGISSFGPLTYGLVDGSDKAENLREGILKVAGEQGIKIEKSYISNTDNEGAKIFGKH